MLQGVVLVVEVLTEVVAMMEVTETTDQEEMVMICQIPAKIEGSRVTNYQEMETTIGSRQFSFIN